jgi:hypothetical protein
MLLELKSELVNYLFIELSIWAEAFQLLLQATTTTRENMPQPRPFRIMN